MRFRLATAGDVPALVALINAAYAPVDWWLFGHARTDGAETRAALADARAHAQVIVGELEGRAVAHGILRLEDAAAELGLVAVARQAQSRGIGALLIAETERRARDAGFDALHLHCIRENGLPAYYAALGYAEAGEERTRDWGARREFTLVHMTKALR
ncbi:MAG TPA: GNAT family N-acetyltransferase [Dehalococcoidia bacterium]|nr:GNAT family N-acetyltransferase [Dehalococcoidia bacterium]